MVNMEILNSLVAELAHSYLDNFQKYSNITFLRTVIPDINVIVRRF